MTERTKAVSPGVIASVLPLLGLGGALIVIQAASSADALLYLC